MNFLFLFSKWWYWLTIRKLITLSYSCNYTDLCTFIRTNNVTSGISIGIVLVLYILSYYVYKQKMTISILILCANFSSNFFLAVRTSALAALHADLIAECFGSLYLLNNFRFRCTNISHHDEFTSNIVCNVDVLWNSATRCTSNYYVGVDIYLKSLDIYRRRRNR